MTTAIQASNGQAAIVEKVMIEGNLDNLTAEQRVGYYRTVCDSLGLNPLTKPFEYLKLNGKLILYARRDCTEQLRSLRKITVTISHTDIVNGVYVVRAKAATPEGRTDESIGAVPVEGLKGEPLANAMMKAETKAKRRVTLSICGLGLLDESEVSSIPGAQPVPVATSQPKQLATSQQQPPADPFEPTDAEIKAAMADGESFQAAVAACGVPWATIVAQLNVEFGTDYTNSDTIENPQHGRWIVRNALYETKRKAAQKKSV